MTGDIDDIVHSSHDVDIAVFIYIAAVTGFVVAGKGFHVGGNKPVFITPESCQCTWRQWEFDDNISFYTSLHFIAIMVQDMDVISWNRFGWGACFDWELLYTHKVADNGPSCFCLPPVVYNRHIKKFACPVIGV